MRHRVPGIPLAALLAALAATVGTAGAQMPGLPVLQNAFANPGITVGVNYGSTKDLTGIGAAGAWAPGSARFVLSAGAGTASPKNGDDGATSYGGRVSAPVLRFMGDALGLGVFAGIGGASQSKTGVVVAGVSGGYRLAMGAMGVSLHVAPSWQRTSASVGGDSFSGSVIRVSSGIDVSFGGRYGATIGVETGAKAPDDEPGPRGTVFGLGLSYALRRVR